MSMNTAHTAGGVLIHQGEVILLHSNQAVLGFSGCDDLKQYTDMTGNCYLTSHRLIFLNKNNTKSPLKSFSFPFGVLSEVDVEQPVFGANFIKGKVRAQENANWRGEAKFKLKFPSGGAIDFAQGMLKAITIARQVNANNTMWNTPPPDYQTATGMPAPAYAYTPATSYYGWTAPNYSFPPPEAGTVYMMEAPPPYPGIGASQPGFTMPSQPQYAPQAYANGNQAFMPMPPPAYTPTAAATGPTGYDPYKKQN